MPISGKTRVVVHLTYPAKHLRTPEFFNPLLERLGYDGVLVPWEVSPANLATAWEGLRGIENLAGVIVTVPHKLEVATLCDELKGTALLLKVCNVAKRLADGRFTGRMFDGDGFVAGLKNRAMTWAANACCCWAPAAQPPASPTHCWPKRSRNW